MKEAIILAGGLGTRLRHVVSDVPKPMAPIGERPFLEFVLDHLVRYEFEHVVLSTGYLHEKIEQHFGDRYRDIQIDYALEEQPLGTGGGMLNALAHCQDDTVAVLNGDTLFRIDYDRLYQFHRSQGGLLSVVLREVEDTSRYGSVHVDDRQRITRFAEKSASQGAGLINGGIYLLEKTLFEGHRAGEKFSFEKEIMEQQVGRHAFFGYAASDYFIDIGIPDDYYRFCQESKTINF